MWTFKALVSKIVCFRGQGEKESIIHTKLGRGWTPKLIVTAYEKMFIA